MEEVAVIERSIFDGVAGGFFNKDEMNAHLQEDRGYEQSSGPRKIVLCDHQTAFGVRFES